MDKEIFGVVSDIKSLSDLFISISYSQSDNWDADRLAKKVLRDPTSASIFIRNRASDSNIGFVIG